jgi:hypothetical protein
MLALEIIIKTIIAFSLLNVWLVRFNRPTPYRALDSESMIEEFKAYGLPKFSLYIVGLIKISSALLLLISVFKSNLENYGFIPIMVLMLGAIIMHLKVNDPIKKALPAFVILLLTTIGLLI